jgi:hypothetical protein
MPAPPPADDAAGAVGPAAPVGAAAPVGPPVDAAWVLRAAAAVGRHPTLWVTGLRQALVLAAPGWWHRRPFLPLPSADYLRFRLQTAYGGAGDRPPDPRDLLIYLHWCRDTRRRAG